MSCFSGKKKPPTGLRHTEVRTEDAPKPIISNRNPLKHQIIGFWKSAAEAAACKFSGPGEVQVKGVESSEIPKS